MGSTKKLLANKNVVTILGMILIVIVLYLFYTWRVNSATDRVSVPTAANDIEKMTEIKESDILMVDVPTAALRGNVVYSKKRVVGRFSGINSKIPQGSFFYYSSESGAGNIVEKDDLPTAFLFEFDLDKDVVAYNYSVNVETTYSNSIRPGKYIDVYLRIKNDDDEGYKTGKLISDLKVLAVKDSAGRNVFSGTNENRTPSMIIFGAPYHYNALLRAAENLSSKIDIIIVPTAADAGLDPTQSLDVNIDSTELDELLSSYIDNDTSEPPVEDDGTNEEPNQENNG